MTHRDAGPDNVMVTQEGSLALIDWDGAGPWFASQELASAAMVWAGVRDHEPDPTDARAVLSSYREAGGTFGEVNSATFACFLSEMLNWLVMNLRRSAGERLRGPEDRNLAAREALRVLEQLPRFRRALDSWVLLLNLPNR